MPIAILLLIGIAGFVYAEMVETDAPVFKGWNLVYGLQSPEQVDSAWRAGVNVKAIYGFDPTTQKYILVYPSDKPVSISDELAASAFWVYSDYTPSTSSDAPKNIFEYDIHDEVLSRATKNLYTGWNFVGIIPNMVDKKLDDIRGNCEISKVYFWNSQTQKWVESETWQVFSRVQIGMGIIVKVSNSCVLNMGEAGITQPPAIPN